MGLPGHFVVKLVGADREVLVDPFHGGASSPSEDCQDRLDRIFGGRVKMEPRMLEAVSPRQILERMLRNLKAIYVEGAGPRAVAGGAGAACSCLGPGSLEDLRDRGLVYAALDCYGLAAARPRGLPRARRPGEADAGAPGRHRGPAPPAARLN